MPRMTGLYERVLDQLSAAVLYLMLRFELFQYYNASTNWVINSNQCYLILLSHHVLFDVYDNNTSV